MVRRPTRDDTPPSQPPPQPQPEPQPAAANHPILVVPDASGYRVGAGAGPPARRWLRDGPSAGEERWRSWCERVFAGYYDEQREHAVRIRRRMWGRLGVLLQHHPWLQEFRSENFTPCWSVRIVKKWIALAKAKAKGKAKAKPKAKSLPQ